MRILLFCRVSAVCCALTVVFCCWPIIPKLFLGTRGNFSCGVADITDAGMGGMGWVWDGCFANNEANILFRWHSSLLPIDGPDDETCTDESFGRFANRSSRSSLGRFRARPGPPRSLLADGGDGELVKPKLRNSESSCVWGSAGLRSSSCSFSNCCNSSLCFLRPARCSTSSSSLF